MLHHYIIIERKKIATATSFYKFRKKSSKYNLMDNIFKSLGVDPLAIMSLVHNILLSEMINIINKLISCSNLPSFEIFCIFS